METYHEQSASPGGVDTPGGLEHIGDVWSLFLDWETMLKEQQKCPLCGGPDHGDAPILPDVCPGVQTEQQIADAAQKRITELSTRLAMADKLQKLTFDNQVRAVERADANERELYAVKEQLEDTKKLLSKAAMSTHRQAMVINECSAYIWPDTSATIGGLPLAVKGVVMALREAAEVRDGWCEEYTKERDARRKLDGVLHQTQEALRYCVELIEGNLRVENDLRLAHAKRLLVGRAAAEGSADGNGEAKSGARSPTGRLSNGGEAKQTSPRQ